MSQRTDQAIDAHHAATIAHKAATDHRVQLEAQLKAAQDDEARCATACENTKGDLIRAAENA